MNLHPGSEQHRVLIANRTHLDPIRRDLLESEDWYRDLVEHSQDLLCVHDLGGRLLSVNPLPARTLGYSVERLLQIPMRELVVPEFQSQFDDYLAEIEREGRASGFLALMTRTGERRLWRYHNTLRLEGHGSPIVRCIAHDVTEQRRAEKLLREASRRMLTNLRENESSMQKLELFRALIDQSNDSIEVVDPESLRFLDVNEKACSILGYSREELLSMTVFDIDPTVTPVSVVAFRERLKKSGSLVRRSLHRRKDTSTFPVEVSIRMVHVERDYAVAVVRDLTDRLRVEEALKESEEKFSKAFRQIPMALIVSSLKDGRYLEVNETFERATGWSREEVLGKTSSDIGLWEDPAARLEAIKQLVNEGRLRNLETRLRMRNGAARTVLITAERMELNGESCVIGVAADITERKHAEERLREYERVVEGLEEMIVVIDRDYRYVIANRAFLSYRDKTKEEVIGRQVDEILCKDFFNSVVKEKMNECFRGKVVAYHMKYTYPRLGERDLFATYFPIEGPNGIDRIAAIMRDTTESNRAEEARHGFEVSLRTANEFSENLIRTANVMILGLDTEGNVNLFNQAAETITGYKFSELKGKHWSVLTPRERFPAVWEEFDKLLQGTARDCYENPIVTKTGEERYIIWRNNTVKVDGRVTGTISFGNDVTDRRRAEEVLRQQAALLDLARDAILVREIKSNEILFWNRGAVDIYGWTAREAVGRVSHSILQTEFPLPKDVIERQMREQGEWEGELTHTTRAGKKIVVATRWSVTPTNEEQPHAILEINRDITERKQAEEALRRSELNYRMFVSQSSEGIFREDLDQPLPIDLPEDELVQHILHDSFLAHCNEAMVKMYGFDGLDQIVGRRLSEMVLPEDPRNVALTREYIRSGFRVIDKESHEVDVHGNPKVFLNSMIGTVENGKLLHTWGIQRDVTEKVKLEEARIQAEAALRENVDRLQVVSEELREAKEKLSEEKFTWSRQSTRSWDLGEIVGHSSALKNAMDDVGKVAPSDATVLLLGETGTGKELMARALHRLSKRKDSSFIKLNCAAIPSGLLESELFGHEKGAFTGAIAKKLGRLELADGGTLFLDEIGDIPLELQPKLLRVLQDQEFERLGGTQTLHVNFRLIAATNRDLFQSVNQRTFRSDLYYRLNVFPIRLPGLRDRREDIPQLVEHFVRKCAGRMNKSISSIPARTMETLVQWAWPGNIRELENFVERSVILTPGKVLQVPVSELITTGNTSLTLQDKERERILRALRECKGQLGGPRGAAARLGLKRTTLQSKLTLFGIDAKVFRG